MIDWNFATVGARNGAQERRGGVVVEQGTGELLLFGTNIFLLNLNTEKLIFERITSPSFSLLNFVIKYIMDITY